ncbi:HAD family hydrolase [Candidatus Undinarchaeota archaeon]
MSKGKKLLSNVKAVAFDLDNTLIDFVKFKEETAKTAAANMITAGLKTTLPKLKKQIWEVYDEYGVEYQRTFTTVLKKYYKIKDPGQFERIKQAAIIGYQDTKFQVLRPYDGVEAVLDDLKSRGLKICIVTDASREKAWQRLIITKLDDKFDYVITLDDTTQKKPSSLPFKTLLRKLKLRPEEVLFVGDNPENDIRGAKAVGMKTALAEYGWVLNKNSKEKADYNLKEIMNLFWIFHNNFSQKEKK